MEWSSFQRIIEILFPRSSNMLFEFDTDKIEHIIDGRTYHYTLQEYDNANLNFSLYSLMSTYIFI